MSDNTKTQSTKNLLKFYYRIPSLYHTSVKSIVQYYHIQHNPSDERVTARRRPRPGDFGRPMIPGATSRHVKPRSIDSRTLTINLLVTPSPRNLYR
ncbi:hypothetical protein RSAG8_04772, partial [Rhizoctonia solani AG-8 WAC10335]